MPPELEANNSPPPEDTSLISDPPKTEGNNQIPEWTEYKDDPAKSAEENVAAKAEHDKTKPVEKQAAEKKDEFVPLADTDIKMPEGMEELPEAKKDFLGILNNRDLKPAEQAQALIDLQAKVMREASERVSAAYIDMRKQWVEQARADPAFGGAKLEENLGLISNLIDTHADKPDELRKVFSETGAGDHPLMIGFLTKVAKLAAEGKPLAGTPSGGIKTEADLANAMYPTMKKS